MRFAVDKNHRDFFQKEGIIEFEGIFTPEQVAALNQGVDQVLSVRCPKERSYEKLFMAGRDLWRDNEELRKFVIHGRLTDTVAELVEQRPLRLAYDQLFPACPARVVDNVYTQFLKQQGSLADVSCIEGILCGVMIPLGQGQENEIEEGNIFSSQLGNAIFFQGTKSISFEQMLKHTGQRFLLVAYASTGAIYRHQERDPHTQALKRLGYRFGERLSDKFHLIVAR